MENLTPLLLRMRKDKKIKPLLFVCGTHLNKNYVLVKSLGFENLFNLLPKCSFVIGNFSSGINEPPYSKIPTINIGERQNGRIFHDSIINCGYGKNEILFW